MATAIIRPNEDFEQQWGITPVSYTTFDNVVTYPDTGGQGDYAYADQWLGLNNNELQGCGFQNLANVGTVTNITIYSLGQCAYSGTYMEVSYSINNGSSWSSEYDCSGHGVSTVSGNGAWDYKSFSVSLSHVEINQIRVRMRADVPTGTKEHNDQNWLYVLYINVTYTFFYNKEPLGLARNSIGKIMGKEATGVSKFIGV